jgi:hypothetical protein
LHFFRKPFRGLPINVPLQITSISFRYKVLLAFNLSPDTSKNKRNEKEFALFTGQTLFDITNLLSY